MKPMSDPIPPAPESPFQPTDGPCPRCRKPLQARTAGNYSRITRLKCSGCQWGMEIEPLLKQLRALYALPAALDE